MVAWECICIAPELDRTRGRDDHFLGGLRHTRLQDGEQKEPFVVYQNDFIHFPPIRDKAVVSEKSIIVHRNCRIFRGQFGVLRHAFLYYTWLVSSVGVSRLSVCNLTLFALYATEFEGRRRVCCRYHTLHRHWFMIKTPIVLFVP